MKCHKIKIIFQWLHIIHQQGISLVSFFFLHKMNQSGRSVFIILTEKFHFDLSSWSMVIVAQTGACCSNEIKLSLALRQINAISVGCIIKIFVIGYCDTPYIPKAIRVNISFEASKSIALPIASQSSSIHTFTIQFVFNCIRLLQRSHSEINSICLS